MKTIKEILKNKSLKYKLLFDFFMLLVLRIGSVIPIYGIKQELLQTTLDSIFGDNNILNTFTGGSFSQMSLFALSITPYITASIIIQLLTVCIPKLEEIQKDGEFGRKKIKKITIWTALVLSILESVGLTISFARQGILKDGKLTTYFIVLISFVIGSMLTIGIAELIEKKGIGNGTSIILLVNILSRFPSDIMNLIELFVLNKDIIHKVTASIIIVTVIVITITLIVILQNAERRIPITNSKKTSHMQSNNYIPIKMNAAGVIPIIFTSSILSIPMIVINLFQLQTNTTVSKILNIINENYWFNPNNWYASIGILLYIALNIIFAYFYTSIVFNPMEMANNLRKQGVTIPGIRPGKSTEIYLNEIMNYLVLFGVIGLMIIAMIPMFFNGMFQASVSFGGTSLIIVVGVTVETIKLIETELLSTSYKIRNIF